MPIETAEVIVIGLGGIGGAAFHHLAKRGVRVSGLEQFPIGHALGSSHGETRIIRKAYFEHPDYVPLLLRAYELWSELERAVGVRLYHETGLLISGPPDGEAVPGARLAAARYGLPLDELSAQTLSRRFPWLRLPDELETVFEIEAGFLEVDRCVELQVREGERLGGRAVSGERVIGWSSDGKAVHVTTEHARYSAGSLVIAAGPWASRVLSDLELPLEVLRKPVAWFPHERGNPPDRPFFVEERGGMFYGIPSLDGMTTKLAEHTSGRIVENPSEVDREFHDDDLAPLHGFLSRAVPGLAQRPVTTSVCMYTVTPDRHFLIDLHPEHRNVAIACGFSGHGFKFASVVGEILADLAMTGGSAAPIGFLKNRWSSQET